MQDIENENNVNQTLIKLRQSLYQLSVLIFSVLFSMFVIWLILFGFDRYNGSEIFKIFLYDPFFYPKRMQSILLVFAPFLIGALAVWICLKAGFINLGVVGQMSASALGVYFVGHYIKQSTLFQANNPFVWLPILLLSGIVIGTLISLLCGFFKAYLGVNEIITTVLINYIVFYLFDYLISLETIIDVNTQSSTAQELGTIINFNKQIGLFSVTFILAIIIFVVIGIFVYKSKLGWKIVVMGKSAKGGYCGGLNINKTTMTVFLIAGAMAGLAGIFYYYRDGANTYLWKSEALPNHGLDVLTIVFLAQSSWWNLPIASFIIALFRVQQKMMRVSVVDSSIIEIMIGLILIISVFCTRLTTDRMFRVYINKIWMQISQQIKRHVNQPLKKQGFNYINKKQIMNKNKSKYKKRSKS